MKAKTLRLLLVGATGAVGQQVLKQALLDERVSAVCAVTRRPLDAEKFPAEPKLENIVVIEHQGIVLLFATFQHCRIVRSGVVLMR